MSKKNPGKSSGPSSKPQSVRQKAPINNEGRSLPPTTHKVPMPPVKPPKAPTHESSPSKKS